MQTFSDRFSYIYPALNNLNFDQVTDSQLEGLAPLVKSFAEMVRTYSLVLKRVSTVEIYRVVTSQVDPRIALILAAARDKKGVRLFPDLDTVKQIMFGPPDESSTTFLNDDLNIFVEGVRRIAASLTASILIGRLAQIEEQAKHSTILESQALADLQRLLEVPDLQEALQAEQNLKTSDGEEKSFYFEDKSFALTDSSISVYIYVPSSAVTSWQLVNIYSTFSTAEIIAELADAINSIALVSKQSNVLAAPVLSGENGLHRIDFKARLRDANISTEVIMVRITCSNPQMELPFKWGVTASTIRAESINSLLLTVLQGKATTTTLSAENLGQPTVLYFKRMPKNEAGEILDYDGATILGWQAGNLTFRVSPTQTEEVTVAIPYNVSATEQEKLDAQRPGQVAETLLNELFAIKGETKALGAIVRNDAPVDANALVALELVAFSLTNPETWLILDILELPKDVQIAVGNLQGPLTPFSNKPKSVRVESTVSNSASRTVSSGSTTAIPSVAKIAVSEKLRQAQDIGRRYQNRDFWLTL